MDWYTLEKDLGASDEMIEHCKKFQTREDFYKSKEKPMFILWSMSREIIKSVVDKKTFDDTLAYLTNKAVNLFS